MKVRDLITLSELPQWKIAYAINITPQHLSRIKNRSISGLSRDLQLKIELFQIKNKDVIDQKIMDINKLIKGSNHDSNLLRIPDTTIK